MKEKYESLALVQLKELAKARGLKGTSAMKKAELVERRSTPQQSVWNGPRERSGQSDLRKLNGQSGLREPREQNGRQGL